MNVRNATPERSNELLLDSTKVLDHDPRDVLSFRRRNVGHGDAQGFRSVRTEAR